MIPGRRTWVYVNQQRTVAGMIVNARRRDRLVRFVRAYEITCCARMLSSRSRTTGNPRDDDTARRLLGDIDGPVCYAMYAKPSHAMKLGRTVNFAARWAKLETSSGMPLQPVAIWQCASEDDTRIKERDLFARYAASRTIGEWFAADDVVSDLYAIAAAFTAPRTVPARHYPGLVLQEA